MGPGGERPHGRDRPPGAEGEKGGVGPMGPEGPGQHRTFRPNWTARAHRPHRRNGSKGKLAPWGPRGEPGVRAKKIEKKGKKRENWPRHPPCPKSAFTVGLTVLSKFPPSDTPIKFDRILYNEFGHYERGHGQVHLPRGRRLLLHLPHRLLQEHPECLWSSRSQVLHTKDGYTGSEDQASALSMYPEAGGRVWLQVTGGEVPRLVR